MESNVLRPVNGSSSMGFEANLLAEGESALFLEELILPEQVLVFLLLHLGQF